jgi:RNA polymerase sigma-70 factor, ECF subfamily
LLESARNGDNSAFEKLVVLYEPRVAATITGMLGFCNEAEDIGQETFVRFYQSLNNFRGDSTVGTYLVRIAINLSLNEIKRRKRSLRRFGFFRPEQLEDLSDKKASATPSSIEVQLTIHHGLQQLDPKFRSVIVLRLIDGYTTSETAEILNIPTGTVLSRLARGQMKLKEIIQPGDLL